MNNQTTISKIISIDALDVSFTSMEEGTRDRKDEGRNISALDRSDHTVGTLSTMLSRHALWNRSNRSLWNRSNRSFGIQSNPENSAETHEEGVEPEGKNPRKSVITVTNMKRGIIFYLTFLFLAILGSNIFNKNFMRTKGIFFSGMGFQKEAGTVLTGIRTKLYSTLGATDAFAISMLAQAKASKQTYPFAKIDDFDFQAERFLANARAKHISTYPVIEEGQHKQWMDYAKNHRSATDHATTYGLERSSQLPLWQYAPSVPINPIYNSDVLLSETEKHMVTITKSYFVDSHNDTDVRNDENHKEPVFDLFYPVFDTLYNVSNHKSDKKLSAYLRLTIRWQDILGGLLPSQSSGLIAVFNNSCAHETFAFEITGSGVPKYLDTGYDEPTYSYYPNDLDNKIFKNVEIDETSYRGVPINEESCPYTVSIYPHESRVQQLLDCIKNINRGTFSDNPGGFVMRIVMVMVMLTTVIIGLFFCFSGRLHREEIRAKSDLLEAKRTFVRFVSHEVRTPLNVVCMGLTLILQEFKKREKELQNKKDGNGDEYKRKDSIAEKKNLIRWSCMAQEVSHNIDVAVGVLNDLLNIDKIEMGNFKLEMETLPVWELIEETVSEFTMMAERQNTDLELDLSALLDRADIESGGITNASMLPPSILRKIVVGDDQRLRQVLRNLLSNAIKFSENRSVTVKVSSTGFKDNRFFGNKLVSKAKKEFELADGIKKSFPRSGRIIVDIIDTGVGMTPFELEKVFNMGTQFHAKEQQSGGGSGLGLTFSKAIVEQLGGSLRALSSGRDKGTTLRLDLPLYTSDSDCCSSEQIVFTPTPPTSPEEPPKVAPRKKVSLRPSRRRHRKAERRHSNPEAQKDLEPMTMLVVDDDTMTSKFMVKMLESYGHTCERLKNGQELVDAFNENPVGYDCILLDYEMPIMNGPEACKSIREVGRTNFVVGVTGNLLPEDIGHFIECGADTVLPKPLKYEELKELLIEYGIGIPIDSNSGHFEATTTPRRSFCRRGTM